MSEQGWRAFLAADGLDDWVVLHGGATAVFDLGSLLGGAGFIGSLAELPGFEASGAVVTAIGGTVSVRLTRDLWDLEAAHIELARAVTEVAREHGAAGDRSRVQEVQFAVAARPDDLDVGFWRAVLGYGPAADDNAVDPLGHGSTVWLQDLDPDEPLRHAMHLDVSVAREVVHSRLEAALAAGGRIVDDGGAPAHWILTDRAGNRVCLAAWPDGAVPAEG